MERNKHDYSLIPKPHQKIPREAILTALILFGVFMLVAGSWFYTIRDQEGVVAPSRVEEGNKTPKTKKEIVCQGLFSEEEITCGEAVDLALVQYPGDLRDIEKKDISIPLLDITGIVGSSQSKLWIVHIMLTTPIDVAMPNGNFVPRSDAYIAVPRDGSSSLYAYDISN